METKENDSIIYWFEDGILFSKFKNEITIDLENIKNLIELRHEISDRKKQYWCIDMLNIKEYKKEARDYAEKHGQEYLHATAAIIHSHISRFIINIFLKLKKSKIPFQAFNSKKLAVLWLNEMRQKNSTK
jgi:hypothetical protein